jgi:DNA-binding NtrC family response regulator
MRLLVVSSDRGFRDSVAQSQQRFGHDVRAVAGNVSPESLRDFDSEVVLLELPVPLADAGNLITRFRELCPQSEIVMAIESPTATSRGTAIQAGVFDVIGKGCRAAEIDPIIDRAGRHARIRRDNHRLQKVLDRITPHSEIIGTSLEIQRVLQLIEKVGPTDSPVLVLGESGTGKELVARAVHQHSQRSSKPMVTINCAALQESLLESELFGHEKGAFTGATTSKPGLFEVADGGTLFIDELGELAPSLQAKLLRVLEDGHMRRVGATREQRVDVRIIAATNRNLAEDVAARRFREDLFFRINVLSIDLPPLRNRRDDIPLLANHFLRKLGRDWTLDEAAMNALQYYAWPGNVRELHNVIERAGILADGSHITLTELPHQISHQSSGAHALKAIEDTDNLEARERLHVQRVLEREDWNRNRTAEALGINRRSLYRLIQKHSLSPRKRGD